jgi:hypothetical protein
MYPESERERVGGQAVNVRDPHIWAAISYLDSKTGYRECLPMAEPQRVPAKSEMVMLDNTDSLPRPVVRSITVFAFASCLFLLFILRFCS